MAESVANAVKRLQSSAATLNRLTDEVAGIYAGLEKVIEEASVGRTAAIEISKASAANKDDARYLEYRRIGDRYRIAYVVGDDNERVKALSECTRKQKVEALMYVPLLLEKLAALIEDEAEEAKKILSDTKLYLGLTPQDKE